MKRLALLTVAIVLATAANLWADDQKPNPAPSGAKAKPGQPAVGYQAKSGAQWYIESLDPVVGLTDEQKKAITDVIQRRDKMMQEFQSTHAESLAAASKAIGEAYKKNDKEAIAKATKAYQDVYAPFHQAMKESQKKLDEILTPQQREKQLDQQATMWIKAMTAPIELSEEQKQKAKTAFREMQKADNSDGRWRLAPEAIAKILTPQQRTALNKSRLLPYMKAIFARVKLTDEQNKKMEALIDKISSDPKLSVDWKTYQDLSHQVEELLTKEQKETLKKPLQFWGQAGGGGIAAGGVARTLMLDPTNQYWIGLSVEPLDAAQGKKLELPEGQGLTVRAVSPDSPAAKAGIKTDDVIVKAGDRTLKNIQDLIQCVQQAKEKDLVLKIMRDGKKQKIAVKPAKRPTEGVTIFQVEGETKEKSVPGAKVRQLPGGGMEVTIEEKGEGVQAKAVEKLDAAIAQGSLGERIKRQHELAEKAWQAYQKMQKLGDAKKGEAHELLEQIERVERELRQTFAPAVGGMGLPPGAPVSGWFELRTREAAPADKAAAIERRQDAAIEELRAQVQKLRRDVDDLESRVKH